MKGQVHMEVERLGIEAEPAAQGTLVELVKQKARAKPVEQTEQRTTLAGQTEQKTTKAEQETDAFMASKTGTGNTAGLLTLFGHD